MKPKTSSEFVPPALQQVWDWKATVEQETRHLSTAEALEYILKQGGAIARHLNLPVATDLGIRTPAALVAETSAKYTVKRRNRAARSG